MKRSKEEKLAMSENFTEAMMSEFEKHMQSSFYERSWEEEFAMELDIDIEILNYMIAEQAAYKATLSECERLEYEDKVAKWYNYDRSRY